MDKLDFYVKAECTNKLRHGVFIINGKEYTFPTQAITSTNLDLKELTLKSDFDFGTPFLDIIEPHPKRIRHDPQYRKDRISEISKIINANPKKLCFLVFFGIKTECRFKITKAFNEFFIDFQYECGFKFIKVFFNSGSNIIEKSDGYRKLIPTDRIFVAVIDENLRPDNFEKLYNDCYDVKKDKIIAFFGRKYNERSKNKFNFLFIHDRKNDQILRLAPFIQRKSNAIINSLTYYYLGIDVYSFWSNNWKPKSFTIEALDKFTYKLLDSDSKLTCAITKKNLYQSFNKYNEIGILKIHDIVEFNKSLKTIYKDYTIEEIEQILDDQ